MKWLNFFLIFLILFVSLMIVRFVFGGNEDEWICEKGNWIKHGNPSYAKPGFECELIYKD